MIFYPLTPPYGLMHIPKTVTLWQDHPNKTVVNLDFRCNCLSEYMGESGESNTVSSPRPLGLISQNVQVSPS